jgi:hypothetical protein
VKTVFEILRDHMAGAKCTGLYNIIGECACSIDDLAPCGGIQEDCRPGSWRTCNCGESFCVPVESNQVLCPDCRVKQDESDTKPNT